MAGTGTGKKDGFYSKIFLSEKDAKFRQTNKNG